LYLFYSEMKQRKTIRVLIIEDSELMRNELRKMLAHDPLIRVAGTAATGEEGVEKAVRLKPDVITIDLNLPGMDGLTALQYIMLRQPTPCIVVSAYAKEESLETFEAFELGAVDVVDKLSVSVKSDELFRRRLIAKIKVAVLANPVKLARALPPQKRRPRGPPAFQPSPGRHPRKIVVIGTSTGGPRTMMDIIPHLPGGLKAAYILVQHMPGNFTTAFAERLDQATPLPVNEAGEGEPILCDRIYVAPGDRHLVLEENGPGFQCVFRLEENRENDLYVPSIDRTMLSALEIFGGNMIGVILTGMGRDGADAMRELMRLGALTIAESEETAIIYGMPREVIEEGNADITAPSYDIAAMIINALKGN